MRPCAHVPTCTPVHAHTRCVHAHLVCTHVRAHTRSWAVRKRGRATGKADTPSPQGAKGGGHAHGKVRVSSVLERLLGLPLRKWGLFILHGGKRSPARGRAVRHGNLRLIRGQAGNRDEAKAQCCRTLQQGRRGRPRVPTSRALGSKPSPYSGKVLESCCLPGVQTGVGSVPPAAEPASTFDSPSSLCVTHTHLLGMKIQVLFKAAESLFCGNESVRLEQQRA